jgi:hypothetical protein
MLCPAVSHGYEHVHIKGESQLITSSLIANSVVNWELQDILLEVRKFLPYFQNFKISHCYQEANKVADWLANLGVNFIMGSCVWEYSEIRLACQDQLLSDSLLAKINH